MGYHDDDQRKRRWFNKEEYPHCIPKGIFLEEKLYWMYYDIIVILSILSF